MFPSLWEFIWGCPFLLGQPLTDGFKGIVYSGSSNLKSLGIECKDTQIFNELRRNANFTILVEGKTSQWYVRANIKGNLPRE